MPDQKSRAGDGGSSQGEARLADPVHYVEFMPLDQIRVASWNLCHGCASLDLLQAQSAAVVLAQEVTAAAFADLRRRFDWGVSSLELWRNRVCERGPAADHRPAYGYCGQHDWRVAAGKSVAVEAARQAPWPGWLLGTGDNDYA